MRGHASEHVAKHVGTDAAGVGRNASIRVRRRAALPTVRRRQIVVRFSDEELAAVEQAAEASGLAVGAWIGEVASRSCARPQWSISMAREDLVRQMLRMRLDLALADRAQREVAGSSVRKLVAAALARLDQIVDGLVGDEPR